MVDDVRTILVSNPDKKREVPLKLHFVSNTVMMETIRDLVARGYQCDFVCWNSLYRNKDEAIDVVAAHLGRRSKMI